MTDQQRIESLEYQVLTLKIAVQQLLKLNYEAQKSKVESYYEQSVLYSETKEIKSQLLLGFDYIQDYAARTGIDMKDLEQYLTDLD